MSEEERLKNYCMVVPRFSSNTLFRKLTVFKEIDYSVAKLIHILFGAVVPSF